MRIQGGQEAQMRRTGKQTKKPPLRGRVTKRFLCPLCLVRFSSNAARMVHAARFHFSDPAGVVEDFLAESHAGVKEYREVIRRKTREMRDVLELERLYRLPSDKSHGVRRATKGVSK